jgi:Ino eighty subunit 1
MLYGLQSPSNRELVLSFLFIELNRLRVSSVGYLSRKALPIKRNDAEPLTRNDVQFDLLNYIFSDTKAVFTSQVPGKSATKVTFSDLYVNALYNSSKCSKVLKDKMIETPAFAIELAKISLLTNVGRINTTMACEHLLCSSRCRKLL